VIRRALVLRPEPGNSRTAEFLRHAGLDVRQMPLFAIRPLRWNAPDPAGYDALLLTSANAARHGGAELLRLRHMPAVAVGEATAHAAVAAGLTVHLTGTGDAAAAVTAAREAGLTRLLHLAGRDRVHLAGVHAIAVYASDPLPITPDALAGPADEAVLLHSVRAAQRFATLIGNGAAQRARTLVALSPAVAAAAGPGWNRVLVAARPDDNAMLAAICAD
jgi:uroporphyrinogen-III synthase